MVKFLQKFKRKLQIYVVMKNSNKDIDGITANFVEETEKL